MSVPIALPAGRNGLAPDLSLTYSTGHGNGPYGLRWTLSVPCVSRLTAKEVPLGDDTRDTFVLSGAEDLVPVSGGVQRYRPRTEGLFARIEPRSAVGSARLTTRRHRRVRAQPPTRGQTYLLCQDK